MQTRQTEVLVIGGGATGTGILRDLAMRGFKTLLVEKGDLTAGTTGRYHGLLHSGGRYAVKDPLAARECIEENRILRRIMPQCIEDTGGFFVVTPWDDPGFAPRFLEGCKSAGILADELSIAEMLRQEPHLNPGIIRCFRVPDASADSFLGAHLNVASAFEYGAELLIYHRVENLLRTDGDQPRVIGARCLDLASGEEITINADYVVNAAGAWAGKIAESAGVQVKIIPGKGTLLAANHRIVHTIINRCRMPSDGDILVPAHTVSIIGTTDIKVNDPEHFSIEPWEVNLLLEEGDKLVPGFKNMRMLRAWAGVRPLYQETISAEQERDNRSVTRAFVLLDHADRDGLAGITTITGGKWTTYRKMAEVTVDLVCNQLGVSRPCRTHQETLPDPHNTGKFHALGGRLAEIEQEAAYGNLICECELVTRQQVDESILHGNARTIDDIRRDVRLGMGPCQGGFCAFRATGILHELSATGKLTAENQISARMTNAALRDFLQERWKGLLPVLWGQQLRQERLDELIYLDVLNVDHLPGPAATRLAQSNYLAPETKQPSISPTAPIPAVGLPQAANEPVHHSAQVIVIGAGLAGLSAAWQASQNGKSVLVLAKGWGTTHWASGCIGVLGYDPWFPDSPVASPEEALERMIRRQPDHPYARIGIEEIHRSLESFKSLCNKANYLIHGSLDRNWLLPSALGSARPICLAPLTMIAGDLNIDTPALIVGFSNFQDFYPHLIAANLTSQDIPAEAINLDLKSLKSRYFSNNRTLAEAFENDEFRQEVISALRPYLGKAGRVGFPAVLGLTDSVRVQRELEALIGLPVFEIPTLPPSIPGIRLHRILVSAIEQSAGRVFDGIEVIGAKNTEDKIVSITAETSVRNRLHAAEIFVLATGGILGGGTFTYNSGYAQEMVFNLPLNAPTDRSLWLNRDFLSPAGHPIFSSGISVDQQFHPVDVSGNQNCKNLYAVGSALGNCDPIRERSMEGVALATGFFVGSRLGGER